MNKRGAGILLHITSLPSPYGIGDLGPGAYAFADFLANAGQSYWQVLPVTPTGPFYGNSPYSSVSTFAGNTLLISPNLLIEDGFVRETDLDSKPPFPDEKCDYDAVIPFKERMLEVAYEEFMVSRRQEDYFIHFCADNASWLDNYSLFVALKKRFGDRPWNEWPWELRDRVAEHIEWAMSEYRRDVESEKFRQYLFFRQWYALKNYCNERGIQIMGDIPIYVSYDSADTWSNAHIFKLNHEKRPTSVAGVPPDYFSATGQLWGNPVYNWDGLKETGYAWWIKRIGHVLKLYDLVRIDHFRGLVAYWEVASHEKNAVNGYWVQAPVYDFFNHLFKRFFSLPIIAEDLGLVTPDVREAMKAFGFPGMKVLLFAFGDDNPMHIYLPHTYEKNFVAYTGTHDNNTARGWFEEEAKPEERERLFRYLGKEVSAEEVNWELIRLALGSIADMVIIPMQDVLGLGQEAQMNRPSVAKGNWEWRLLPERLTGALAERLGSLTRTYGRT